MHESWGTIPCESKENRTCLTSLGDMTFGRANINQGSRGQIYSYHSRPNVRMFRFLKIRDSRMSYCDQVSSRLGICDQAEHFTILKKVWSGKLIYATFPYQCPFKKCSKYLSVNELTPGCNLSDWCWLLPRNCKVYRRTGQQPRGIRT